MDQQSLMIIHIGMMLIWMSVGVCVGWTVYWLFWDKKGVIHSIRDWTEDEKNNIITVYLYLISAYCLTLVSSMYFFSSPLLLKILEHYRARVVFCTLAATAVMTHHQEVLPYTRRNKERKNWIWFFQAILIGPSLTFFGSTIFTIAIFDSLLATVISTLLAFSAPQEFFNHLIPYINFLYSAVFVSSVLNFLFVPPVNPFSIFLLVMDFLAGTVLYFLVFTANTQYVLREARIKIGDPINNATVMYLCTLNLYLRITIRYLVNEVA